MTSLNLNSLSPSDSPVILAPPVLDELDRVGYVDQSNESDPASILARQLEQARVAAAPKVVLTPEEKAAADAAARAEIKAHRWDLGIDWPPTIWLTALHIGALAAPFYFTWKGLFLMMFLWWVTGSLGICLGYHRLFTHAGFSTYRPMKWLIAFIGGLAGEGSAINWVANHRKHHALSDKPGDPHSPVDGGMWAHMVWLAKGTTREKTAELHKHWAPDLLRDPVLRFLDTTFLVWHLISAVTLWTVGYVFWDTYTAWSFLIYGMFLRLVVVLHSTWFVNSATHMWGYRNYETSDESRNSWWVALLTFGEGWHNNHHAYPRMAKHGHKWWEVDVTYMAIRTLQMCGLAWNIVDQIPTTKPK